MPGTVESVESDEAEVAPAPRTPPFTAPEVPPRPVLRRRKRLVEIGLALAMALGILLSVLVLPPLVAGGAVLAIAGLYLLRGVVFNWTSMLFILAAVIMFIPVRRYALPIPLPFALEPYRAVIAVLLIAIVFALRGNNSMRPVRIPFGWAIAAFLGSLVISLAANAVSLTQHELVLGSIGGIAQLAFLLAIAFVVRQLLTTERLVFALLNFIVWAGVIVAVFAVVERATKVNVFLLLNQFLPLILLRDESQSLRAGGARAYSSSQHPIALAVLLCMIIPIAIYLSAYAARPLHPITRRLVYGVAVGVMFAGLMTAVSRTAVVVLAVMFLLTLILRPALALTLGLLALPIGILGAALLPSVFESMVLSFLDPDTLISSQYTSPGFRGQGRLADLGPAFGEFVTAPFLGTGPGSRIVVGPDANSYILDNQVLGTLLETGVVGVIGLAVLVVGPVLALLARSVRRHIEPKYALLGFTIAISMSGYIAAMFFYDAFSFIQTFMLLMILFAVGGWLLDERLPRATGLVIPRRWSEH